MAESSEFASRGGGVDALYERDDISVYLDEISSAVRPSRMESGICLGRLCG
jgi:hypothetical protein